MKYFHGQKLSDGKTIGGAGRLTDNLINLLHNYYGDAIDATKETWLKWWSLFKPLYYIVTKLMMLPDTIYVLWEKHCGASGKLQRQLETNITIKK